MQRILQDFMKKNNTWNIRRLVDESFVPSAQRTSVIYCRLTDLWSQDGWVMPPSLKWARLSSCQMGQRGAKKEAVTTNLLSLFNTFLRLLKWLLFTYSGYLYRIICLLSVLYGNRKTSWQVNDHFFMSLALLICSLKIELKGTL